MDREDVKLKLQAHTYLMYNTFDFCLLKQSIVLITLQDPKEVLSIQNHRFSNITHAMTFNQ